MALMYAVKCGWKETLIHKDIQGIIALAKEWSSRSEVFVEHIQKSLSQSVGSYNTAIQSFESRFLVTMRKLTKESEIASNRVEPLSTPCAELSISQEGSLPRIASSGEKRVKWANHPNYIILLKHLYRCNIFGKRLMFIKTHDSRWFAKWHQLYKLCGNNKNEAGHYERKESILGNANTPGSPPLES
ncbi:hypothetical protein ACTFIW_008764 [Dictyostelium discoideum]